MKRPVNTTKKCNVRYVAFKEGANWYAAGLELNLVEAGSTPQEALLLLFEAIQGYVETSRKIKVRPYVLNQKPDAEYELLWNSLASKKQASPKGREVYTIGQMAF